MPSLQDTSVAEEYRYLKTFDFSFGAFDRDINAELEFSDTTKVFFDNKNSVVRLKKQADGFFPTDSDIWFRTWMTNPKSARELLMIQVMGNNFKGLDGETDWNVRLYDGTNHLYWDGGSWSIAGSGDWNTEAEVNANLSTYPFLPNRNFAIVVNLVTSDRYYTPIVTEIKSLLKIRIDYMEDLIYRSLFPMMEDNIRPLANWNLPAPISDTDTFDLNNYNLDTRFDIVDVDAVYDFTNDDELLYNLLDNYNPSTKVITLTSDIVAGNVPFVLFRYKPNIIYTTQQDYSEEAIIPCVVIQRIEIPTEQSYSLAAKEGIVDKGTGDAVVFPIPSRSTLQLRVHMHVDKGVDLMRMVTKVMEFFDEFKSIRSIGLDETYRMQIVREYRDLINPKGDDELTFWTQFNIYDVMMPFISNDEKGVQRLRLVFKGIKDINEDPLLGGTRTTLQSHEEDGPFSWEETFDITE